MADKVFVQDIAITSLDMITGFALAADGGAFMFALDELQDATLSQSEDKVDITGKQGRKITSLKRNKAVTVSGTNGLLSSNLLAAQVGSEFEQNDTTVMWYDNLVVDENHKAKLNYAATGTAGNEIDEVYVKGSDGVINAVYEQDTTAGDGKFTYDTATKEITFPNAVAKDTEIVVYYQRKINASVLTNFSDQYSAKCQLYIDATGEDICGNLYHVQFYIPKADFSGTFDLTLGGDQTTHGFEAESLAGGCGVSTGLWTYTVFGVTTADVT